MTPASFVGHPLSLERALVSPLATSSIQRHMWAALRGTPAAPSSQVRGMRVRGHLEQARLLRAVTEVVSAIELLDVNFRETEGELLMVPRTQPHVVYVSGVGGETPEARDQAGADILREQRDHPVDPGRDQLARFHVLRLGPEEAVIGLVAHALLLDAGSIHAVLGAVLRSYVGAFEASSYPSFADFTRSEAAVEAAARESRMAWWSRRLEEWTSGRASGAPAEPGPSARVTGVAELPLDPERWERLANLAPGAGNTSFLAVVAILASWLHVHRTPAGPIVFSSVLDLRDYLALEGMVGPLSDRLVFAVELDGYDRMSFRDLLVRTHAGLLDAVFHYLPYGLVVAAGAERGVLSSPRVAACWDFFVHYCRRPLRSHHLQSWSPLVGSGLSVGLFAEAQLVRGSASPPEGTWDGVNFELHAAEADDRLALVLEFNSALMGRAEVERMLQDLDTAIDRVAGEPTLPLRALWDRR